MSAYDNDHRVTWTQDNLAEVRPDGTGAIWDVVQMENVRWIAIPPTFGEWLGSLPPFATADEAIGSIIGRSQ